MKYSEVDELINDTEEFLSWLKNNREKVVQLPSMYGQLSIYNSVYCYPPGDYTKVDEFATHAKMRRIAKALSPVEKEYNGTSFNLRKTFGKNISITFSTSRETVCEKKVVEVKKVPKKKWIEVPGEYVEEEVVEWRCTDSLLAPR